MIATLIAAGSLWEKHLLNKICIISLIANTMIFLGMIFKNVNPAYGIACSLLTIVLTIRIISRGA